MASNYSARESEPGDATFWIAAISGAVLLAVLITAVVVYFIGSTLSYAA